MSLSRRILFTVMLAAMGAWALAVFGILKITETGEYALWGLWMLLLLAESIAARRERPAGWKAPEPSAAWNVAGVILATGTAGVFATLSLADDPSGTLLVPLAIAGVTIMLAIIAFRFARKHAGEIGEARFETRPAGDA